MDLSYQPIHSIVQLKFCAWVSKTVTTESSVAAICIFRYDTWKAARSNANPEQPLMSNFAKTQITYQSCHSRQREIERAIVCQLIVSGNLPISIVEQSWFKAFMKIMDPKFVMPGRRRVTNLIEKEYQDKRKVLMEKLSAADSVSITIDLWSDRSMRSFVGQTVHFLNESNQFESFTLDMTSFAGRHTGDKIANHCLSVVEGYGIQRKVNYVVTDNAANMLKAFQSIPELFGSREDEYDDMENENSSHDQEESGVLEETGADSYDEYEAQVHLPDNSENEISIDGAEPLEEEQMEQLMANLGPITKLRLSCAIHSLQLVVTDGLKGAKFMTSILSKSSKLATLIHTSGNFSTRFLEKFHRTIPSTTNTRWNSVYLQLEALSRIDPSQLQTLLIEEKHENCILTRRETNILKEVVQVLEPAYTATLIMEEETALVSVVAPSVTALHKKWLYLIHDLEYCQTLAKGLFDSLNVRFCGLINNLKPTLSASDQQSSYGTGSFGNLIYVISPSLDPDFRLEWLNEWQEDHDNSVKSRVRGKLYVYLFMVICHNISLCKEHVRFI